MTAALARGLQSEMAVVLQAEASGGGYRRKGFSGLPLVNPCQSVLTAPVRDGEASRQAFSLKGELPKRFLRLHGGRTEVSALPCGGSIGHCLECQSQSVLACPRLVLVVGDGTSIVALTPPVSDWLARDDLQVPKRFILDGHRGPDQQTEYWNSQ